MSVFANLFVAGAIAIRCNKKIEECYGMTAIVLSLLLYIPGLYYSFNPGLLICGILFVISVIYCVWIGICDKGRLKQSVFTAGFVFLIACIIFFAFYSFGRGIDTPDDFYFWNLRVKNFIYFNKIRGVPSTERGNHPPIIPIWNYLAVKTSTGVVSQGICLWSQNVLLLSLMAPLFREVGGKHKIYKGIITAFIIFLIPAMTGETYHMLIADFMLGALLFYGLYAYYRYSASSDRFYAVCFIASAIEIVMTKRIGACFLAILLVTCVLGVKAEIRNRRINILLIVSGILAACFMYSWEGTSQEFIIILCGICVSVVCGVCSWCLKRHGKNILYPIICLAVIGVLCGGYFILKKYDAQGEWLQYVLGILTTDPKISFIEGIIDSGIVICILYKKTEGYTKNTVDIRMMGVAYYIGIIAYVMLMWYLAITTIGPANGGFAGVSIRYFVPLLMPLYCIVLFLALHMEEKSVCITLLLVLLMVHACSDSNSTIYYTLHKAEKIEFNEFSRNNIVLTPNDRVFFIDEYDGYGYTDRAFYNYICPAKSQFGISGSILEGGNAGAMKESLDELTEQLMEDQYNYVYIQLISDATAQEYSSLFESQEEIGNGRLYEVNYTEDGCIQLRWIHSK